MNPHLPDLIYLNSIGPTPVAPLPLMQAYGELLVKAPQYEKRYIDLLAELNDKVLNQPLVQAALGRKALRDSAPGSNRSAIEHLSKAIELGFAGPGAYEDLSEALSREGKTREAIDVLKRGIELSPYEPRLHKFLAVRYINSKDYE